MSPNATPLIQIAQPGYDVRNCPDWAYLFNSDWPSLSIVFEKTVPVFSSSFSVTIEHNLGFNALGMAWFSNDGVNYGRLPQALIQVSESTVYVYPNYDNVNGTVTVRLYNIDVSKDASYSLPISANAKLPYNNNFGGKIVKNGRNITSQNMNDFILHTRCQSPAILDVATERGKYAKTLSNGHTVIEYPVRTKYLPFYIVGWGTPGDGYQFGTQAYYDNSTNSITIDVTESVGGSIIVLRDPLFYPNTVQAIY